MWGLSNTARNRKQQTEKGRKDCVDKIAKCIGALSEIVANLHLKISTRPHFQLCKTTQRASD